MTRHIKQSLAASFIFFLLSFPLPALGAGIQLGGIPGLFINQDQVKIENITANLSGSFKMERLPVTLGSGVEFGKLFSDFNYGFSLFADYRAIDLQIQNTWSFYSGFGASIKVLTSDFSEWSLAAGSRFFAGCNWLFYDGYLELYLQQNIVPTYLKDLNSSETEAGFILCLPLEAGIRMHF